MHSHSANLLLSERERPNTQQRSWMSGWIFSSPETEKIGRSLFLSSSLYASVSADPPKKKKEMPSINFLFRRQCSAALSSGLSRAHCPPYSPGNDVIPAPYPDAWYDMCVNVWNLLRTHVNWLIMSVLTLSIVSWLTAVILSMFRQCFDVSPPHKWRRGFLLKEKVCGND